MKIMSSSLSPPTSLTINDSHYVLLDTSLPSDQVPDEKSPAPSSSSSLAISRINIHSGKMRGASRKGKSKMSKNDGKSFSLLSGLIPNMKFRFPDNKPFKYVQTYENLGALTQSATLFAATVTEAVLSNLPQYTSFTAIFDQYRFSLIEHWVLCRNPQIASGATVNQGLLYTVVDYDDASLTLNSGFFEEYTNCVVTPAYDGHYRTYVPHIATAAYSGSFTSYANETAPWLDCASPNIIHYGLKTGVSAADVAADCHVYDILTRVHVEFRNVR
jgi:hypothetical protein